MILVFDEIFLRAHCACEDEGRQPQRILSSPTDELWLHGVNELLSLLPSFPLASTNGFSAQALEAVAALQISEYFSVI